MIIIEKDIDFYTASKETYQNKLRRCLPGEEKKYREIIAIHNGVIDKLKHLLTTIHN